MGANRSIVWLVISILSLGGGIARAQQQADASGAMRRITVKVIDENTQQPIGNATVRRIWANVRETATVDQAGVLSFDWPRDDMLVLYAEAPGHAGVRIGYYSERGRRAVVPEVITVALPAARTISARVVNEDGEPVVGAKIKLSGSGVWDRESPMSYQFTDIEVVTDAEGRWSFDRAPDALQSLSLDIRHPDYIATLDQHSSMRLGDRPPSTLLPAVYDGTGTTTLARGVKVHGTVVDPEGKPVAGALIRTRRETWAFLRDTTTSGPDGTWSFRAPEGDGFLCVEAPDLAPFQGGYVAKPDARAMNITMPRGWVLRGRVVDPNGMPRAGVHVAVETIGGDRMHRYPVDWSGRTDADGRFEWHNAPDDGFTLDIYGSDKLMRLSGVPVARSDDEVSFTMHEALSYRGVVTDAKTSKPITKFTLVPGVGWSGRDNEPMHFNREGAEAYESADGSFFYAVDFPREAHSIMIEAEGYAPFQSGVYHNDDGAQTINVALEPSQMISCRLVQADGRPVENAVVYVGTAGDPVRLHKGTSMPPPNEAFHVSVDADGRFTLPAQVGPFAIAAVNDYGVALAIDADVKTGAPITLQPWARIEGVLSPDGPPMARRHVNLEMYQDQFESLRFIVVHEFVDPDSGGRFVFEKVPPGQVRVEEMWPIGEHASRGARMMSFNARPGEQLRSEFGTTGVNITAQLVAAGDGPALDFSNVEAMLTTDEQPPLPEDWKSMSPQEKQEWMHDWQHSPAGREWERNRFSNAHFYSCVVDADGVMHARGVVPGDYQLRVSVFSPQSDMFDPSNAVAQHSGTVTVPDGAREHDLGSINLERMLRVSVGDVAPDFTITTLDGQPLKLADYRGKYVFLDFWATWCGPCKAEIPNVKAMHEAMKSRDDFVLISLSLDNDAALPTQYAKDNGMAWTQGFLGKWSDDGVTKAYGVRGIPATFLIGPDARVVASNLRGDGLIASVRKAMKLK